MDRARPNEPLEGHPPRAAEQDEEQSSDEPEGERSPKANPPRTTTDGITLPKFGSAGSGGAEVEPGPERD